MKLLTLLIVLLGIGCATKPRPAPLGQADIISMTKAGVSDEEIIKRIDLSRSLFRLGSQDVIFLHDQGVSDRVINYMLDTYAKYVAAEQRRQDRWDEDWRFRFGFHYHHGHYWRRCR